MKYSLKVDLSYILLAVAIIFIPILILSFTGDKLFTLGEATIFVLQLLSPGYIVLALFYFFTVVSVNEKGLTIKYFGLLEKTILHKNVGKIERSNSGRGTLALSKDKILIQINSKDILLSIKHSDCFMKEFNHKKRNSLSEF